MAESFATPADVEDRWRPLSSAEENVADTLCSDASSIIRNRYRDVDARLEAGTLDPGDVIRVTATMVKRAMLVGDNLGVSQASQTVGPFAQSATYSNPNANLYLSADEVAVFDPEAVAGRSGRAYTGWLA